MMRNSKLDEPEELLEPLPGLVIFISVNNVRVEEKIMSEKILNSQEVFYNF